MLKKYDTQCIPRIDRRWIIHARPRSPTNSDLSHVVYPYPLASAVELKHHDNNVEGCPLAVLYSRTAVQPYSIHTVQYHSNGYSTVDSFTGDRATQGELTVRVNCSTVEQFKFSLS